MSSARLGLCVLCGDRVNRNENYIVVDEGYCHRGCIKDLGFIGVQA